MGKEERIGKSENRAPELAGLQTSSEKRQAQNRKRRDQAVEGWNRRGKQLAQNHIVPLEVCEKKQAKSAFTFLPGQTIRGLAQTANRQ